VTSLANRVAVVTGAASGIKRATALRLAADGAAVGCLGLGPHDLDEVAAEIRGAGGRAIAAEVDVRDRRAVDVAFDDWQRVIDVHVTGAFHVTQAVLPAMLEAGWGRVITVASEVVWLGHTSVRYATAKAALVGFTRSLARQVAGTGVLVNALAPGPVETAMLLDNTPAEIEAERSTVLIGRFLQPVEIAASISFLAGPGGAVYVGQVLSPNGGTVFPG
jgi:3-oxoacyl-[acyl-carrier protein] reductase